MEEEATGLVRLTHFIYFFYSCHFGARAQGRTHDIFRFSPWSLVIVFVWRKKPPSFWFSSAYSFYFFLYSCHFGVRAQGRTYHTFRFSPWLFVICGTFLYRLFRRIIFIHHPVPKMCVVDGFLGGAGSLRRQCRIFSSVVHSETQLVVVCPIIWNSERCTCEDYELRNS